MTSSRTDNSERANPSQGGDAKSRGPQGSAGLPNGGKHGSLEVWSTSPVGTTPRRAVARGSVFAMSSDAGKSSHPGSCRGIRRGAVGARGRRRGGCCEQWCDRDHRSGGSAQPASQSGERPPLRGLPGRGRLRRRWRTDRRRHTHWPGTHAGDLHGPVGGCFGSSPRPRCGLPIGRDAWDVHRHDDSHHQDLLHVLFHYDHHRRQPGSESFPGWRRRLGHGRDLHVVGFRTSHRQHRTRPVHAVVADRDPRGPGAQAPGARGADVVLAARYHGRDRIAVSRPRIFRGDVPGECAAAATRRETSAPRRGQTCPMALRRPGTPAWLVVRLNLMEKTMSIGRKRRTTSC